MKNIIQTKLSTQKMSKISYDFACLNFQNQNSVPFKTTQSDYTDTKIQIVQSPTFFKYNGFKYFKKSFMT